MAQTSLTLPSPFAKGEEEDESMLSTSESEGNFISQRIPETTRKARALRQNQTPAEKLLWEKLRGRRFHNLKFRRQSPIGQYIVDFLCLAHRLVIELDGCVHQWQQERDAQRQQYLESGGYTFLRFSNLQVKELMDWVLARIAEACTSG